MRKRNIHVSRRRARIIQEGIAEGLNTDEIGAQLKISGARVRHIAMLHGIILARPHTRRLAFYTTSKRFNAIHMLAVGAETSVGVMIDRIVASVLDDGPDIARRRLGVLALPPKGGTDAA